MSKQNKKLHEYLTSLNLTHLRAVYSDVSNRAVKENMDYESYLLELIEHEWLQRRHNRIERMFRESKLPLEKSLQTFDMTRLPKKIIHQVKLLCKGLFLDQKENVLAFGNPGSGKTHLLCAIGQELIRQGKRVYFIPSVMLVQKLLQAKRELQLPRLIKRLSRYDAIIIDDLGYVQQDRQEMEVLFTLLSERYERGSIMLTSNLPFSKWETIFKDPMVTAAAIDRLVHHSTILELNISSYRTQQAKTRKEADQNQNDTV